MMTNTKCKKKKYSVIWNGVIEMLWASLVGQMVKNLPSMQETWIRSLGQEDPKE